MKILSWIVGIAATIFMAIIVFIFGSLTLFGMWRAGWHKKTSDEIINLK